jgi:hypothetical protein
MQTLNIEWMQEDFWATMPVNPSVHQPYTWIVHYGIGGFVAESKAASCAIRKFKPAIFVVSEPCTAKRQCN